MQTVGLLQDKWVFQIILTLKLGTGLQVFALLRFAPLRTIFLSKDLHTFEGCRTLTELYLRPVADWKLGQEFCFIATSFIIYILKNIGLSKTFWNWDAFPLFLFLSFFQSFMNFINFKKVYICKCFVIFIFSIFHQFH